jgi:hypothetical protein
MRREAGPGGTPGRWLLLIALLLLVVPVIRLLAATLLGLPALLLVGGVIWWLVQRAPVRWGEDPLDRDVRGARRRLRYLTRQSTEMAVQLQEVRRVTRLQPGRPEEVAASFVLERVRELMARERAVLLSVDTARWLAHVDALFFELEQMDLAQTILGIRAWCGRLSALAAAGASLQRRLQADLEVTRMPVGLQMFQVTSRVTAALATLRAELLCRHADLLTRLYPDEFFEEGDPEQTLQRLRGRLRRARHRRWTRAR